MTTRLILTTTAVIVLGVLTTGLAAGQDTISGTDPSTPTAWRSHEITVRGGFVPSPDADVAVSPGTTSTDVSGFLGTIQYDYWPSDQWAIGIAAGVFDAGIRTETRPGAVTSSVASITTVQLGLTYRPTALAVSPALRPFLSLSAGPYVRSFIDHRVGDDWYAGIGTSTAPGARILVGLDLRFAGALKLGVAGGYHLIGQFDDPIGAETDHSGPEFSVAFGVGFGRGS